jgi:hypothetical protein
MQTKKQMAMTIALALSAAFTANAQSALFSSYTVAANTAANNGGKQYFNSEVYMTAPAHIVELNDMEAVVTVLDAMGKREYTAIVLDGKFQLPTHLSGMLHTLDIVGEQAHQTFEFAVREADDAAETLVNN